MTRADTPYLFVYGTLMSSAGGALGARERERLAREGVRIGPARVAGCLYDLGTYPGLARAAASNARVDGEILKLLKPEATFAWLDAYEGIGPQFPRPEYCRRVLDASLVASPRSLRAWTYLLLRQPVMSRKITSGAWSAGR